MADRNTIKAGVWSCIVAEWNAGNTERAQSLERFLTALEERETAVPSDATASLHPAEEIDR